MRGVVFLGDRELELRELPKPTPGLGEVVIAMKASGLCGSDFTAYRAPKARRGPPEMLKVGGHEDFLLAPASTCVSLPDGLSFAEGAACACGTGTAFHALKRLNLVGADTIAIFGQGPVGLSATLFAAAMGARVIAIDVIPDRLELTSHLGAEVTVRASQDPVLDVIRQLTHGEGADATLDATGIPEVRLQAVDSAKLWGRVCFVGEGNTTTFDVSPQIIHKQLTIYGSWTFSTGGLAAVAQFVVDRQVPLRDLITHTFALHQAAEAYQLFDTGRTGKVVLVWP